MANRKISELTDAAPLTGAEQVEVRRSSSNLRTTTQEIANLVDDELPPGGSTGQVLTKASNSDGDVDWEDVPGGGGGGDSTIISIPKIAACSFLSNGSLQGTPKNVVSVESIGTGIYLVHFTPGFFASAPYCVANVLSGSDLANCRQATDANTVEVDTYLRSTGVAAARGCQIIAVDPFDSLVTVLTPSGA